MEVICVECNKELQIGDYPYCPHESIYPQFAQAFSPVVIHRDAEGNLRFPGHANAPVPDGFQKVELTTVHQIRQLEREVNQRESFKSETVRQVQREKSQAEHAERRAFMKEAVKRMSGRGRQFAEAMMQAKDQRKGRLDRPSGDPNFHVEAFSFDRSNREAYNDRETGWKSRRD